MLKKKTYFLPNVISSYGKLVQGDRIAILDRHFDALQVGVHRDINSCDGAVNLKSNQIYHLRKKYGSGLKILYWQWSMQFRTSMPLIY